MHPLVTFRTGRYPVHIALGRLMAALLICLWFWSSVHSDRATAKHELAVLSPGSYAAGYEAHRKKTMETAEQSDADLIGLGFALLVMVLGYEGLAWGIGAGLGYLDAIGTKGPPGQ